MSDSIAGTPPTLAELLEHSAWLKALARGLVRDESRAADVVQETWIVALRGGPNRRESAKGWLRSVAQNVARQGRRKDTRRREREQRVGRAESADPGEQACERMEVAEMLASSVRALPEPYRSAIVQRFYDGLTPSEIAEREGVSVRTIESRLRRGLAKLREVLDRRHQGDREAWFSGVAVIAALGVQEGAGSAFGLGTLGALLTAGLLLGAALLGGRALLHGPADRAEETETASARADAPLVSSPTDEAELAASTPAAERSDAVQALEHAEGSDASLARWRGRLLRASDGSPLAGLTVELRTRHVSEATILVSDADGWIETVWEPGRGGTRLHVPATSDTRAMELPVEFTVEFTVDAPRPEDGLEGPGIAHADPRAAQVFAILPRGGTIVGRCVDANDQPLARVEVLAWRDPRGAVALAAPTRSTLTDSAGEFVIEDLANDRGDWVRVALLARAPGLCSEALVHRVCRGPRAEAVADERLDAQQLEPCVLYLVPSWSLSGRVNGAGGTEPDARTSVLLEARRAGAADVHRPQALELELDARGRFEAEVPARAATLVVSGPESPTETRAVDGPGTWLIELRAGATLKGRVVDGFGTPIPGARVEFRGRESREPRFTDARGEFAFTGLSEDARATVSAMAADAVSVAHSVDVGAAQERIELRLEQGRSISGVVETRFGDPMAKVEVALEHAAGLDSERVVNTRADGSFRFDGLAEREVVLVVRRMPRREIVARHRVRTRLPGEDAERERVVVGEGLVGSAAFRGRALLADGRPATRFVLVATRVDEPGEETLQISDETGSFVVPGLTPGSWTLRGIALDPELGQLEPVLEQDLVLAAGETRAVELRLSKP